MFGWWRTENCLCADRPTITEVKHPDRDPSGADGELCVLFARNVGNYGMNKVPPDEILARLRERDSEHVRFLVAHWRRSGNFVVWRNGVADREVEDLAHAATGFLFACRPLRIVKQIVEQVRKTPGFDESSYSVVKDRRPRKIAVSLVAGSEPLPDLRKLRSSNSRVLFMEVHPARAVISLYDRPRRGGDFGEPNRVVERALIEAGLRDALATTRSLRVLDEVVQTSSSAAVLGG